MSDITDAGSRNKFYARNDLLFIGSVASSNAGVLQVHNASTETTAPVLSLHGIDKVSNAKFFGDGKIDVAGDYHRGGTKVVGTQQTGINAMTNVSTPANWDADTVTVAQLADIVGTLIIKLRTHGLVAD